MPVVRFDANDLDRLVGRPVPRGTLVERLPMIGGDLDKVDGDQVTIEFFPNRPDLLSVEGVARACRAFFDVRPGLPSYPVAKGDEEVLIEPGVAKVRPFIAFARVNGLALDDQRLQDLIDFQERLTLGPGRRRKKVAIGIHDARDVKAPFSYKAVKPDAVTFEPLGYSRPMSPAQILKEHEKGRLYADLVKDHATVPLIVDAQGHVLSFPPVINGTRTQLTTRTTDVLVDVTGTDRAAVDGVLNIVVTALAERGGRIVSLTHRQAKRTWRSPDLKPARWKVSARHASQLLGVPFTSRQLKTCLERMGHGVTQPTKAGVTVEVGAWRLDMLHPVDLIEEVAIGYGFDTFEARLPTRAMFGSQRAVSVLAQRARTALLGQGFTEVLSLTLTGPADAQEALGQASARPVRVENPVTQDHSILRAQLFPSLLALLRANKRNPLPQAVFEVGAVVPDASGHPRNQLRAALVRVASRASFSEVKSVAQAVLRDLGMEVTLRAGAVAGLLEGRTALLAAGRRDVGFFGEVAPQTLANFDLEAPAYVMEVVLDPAPATP